MCTHSMENEKTACDRKVLKERLIIMLQSWQNSGHISIEIDTDLSKQLDVLPITFIKHLYLIYGSLV